MFAFCVPGKPRVICNSAEECLAHMLQYSSVPRRSAQVVAFLQWANNAKPGDIREYEDYYVKRL